MEISPHVLGISTDQLIVPVNPKLPDDRAQNDEAKSHLRSSWTHVRYILGSLILLLGLFVTGLWMPAYDNFLVSVLRLKPNGRSYDTWKSNPVPIIIQFHLFNWTNPEATLKNKELANFVEIGPYAFEERREKHNVTWNANNTVSFTTKHTWIFLPQLSKGSLDDQITSLNVVPVTIANICKDKHIAIKFFLNEFLKEEEKTLYIRKSVRELLFDGYEDDILKFLVKLKKELDVDIDIPFSKFGWYFEKNNTEDGYYNMFTGTDDINKLGLCHSWNNKTRIDKFSGNCSLVRGTNGEVWPKNASFSNEATFFIPDICGSISLTSKEKVFIRGMDCSKFTGQADVFDNGTTNEGCRCYCSNNVCPYASGVRSLSPCIGAPVYLSFPHFLLADESYRRDIVGMKPQQKLHEFYITLQKDTGIVTDVRARLQMNVLLEPISGIGMFEGIPRIFVPALWFEQSMIMPDEMYEEMRILTVIIPKTAAYGGFALVVTGAVIVIVGLYKTRIQYAG